MKASSILVLALVVPALAGLGISTASSAPAGDRVTPAPGTARLPRVGKPAPDFTLPATTGADIKLSQLKGKTVVLYFYPKDETPGCTHEACDFRDHTADLEKAGVVVLGVSNDDIESHLKFKEHEKLPFPLLADTDATVSKEYGVYVARTYEGVQHTGIMRTTFVIDKRGRVAKVWPKVNVDGHVAEVLKFVNGS
jgi:peroxiredoxin Q/BCP